MINVRTLERRINIGLVEGKALENTKATLEKIKNRDSRVDAWDVINNEGTYGTEIVITREGYIDLYLCINKKWSNKISYVRVGNFQPEFSLGEVQLMNGKEVEYKKLGNIINALNKEYEKYGFYFDTKNNRSILADAKKAYILDQNEIKMKKQEEEEVEKLQKALVEKTEELLGKEVTLDIDGEGKVEEIKDATYADANANYKRRMHQAPEKGNGYNKTFITIKVDGKKFHEVSMCLQSDTKHYTLKDALLAQIDVLRKTWVEGSGVPYLSPEKNQAVIEQKYGSKEKLAISLNAKELVIKNLGEVQEPTPDPEKMEEKEMNTINKNGLNNKMTDLENQIKEHICAVIDLATKENNGVGYMYKKTIAVKKESGYQLTSLFEDMWTGVSVYVGHSGNMIMTPNSEKSFLTDIIESVMCNRLGVDEGAIKIQEKIKKKFECSYSKSMSMVEPDETKVYVLMTRSDVEVFWSYEDAYSKMVKDAKETAEEWGYGKELIIDEYGAKVDVFKWTIMEKIVQ